MTTDTQTPLVTPTENQAAAPERDGAFQKNRRPQRRPQRRDNRREERVQEFEQRMLGVRRVTRVVSGGRRFSFSVALVIGNRQGKVGVGLGKSTDTSLAIEKAYRAAKKSMVELKLTEDKSIPHELEAKYKASILTLRPAKGKGLVAGSSVRDVLELAGITDVSGKLLSRSKNKINNARVAVEALREIAK